MSRKIAVLLAGALVTVFFAPPSFAVTDRWAAWSPSEGASNSFRLTMTQRSPGFPAATVVSDSRSPIQVPSGVSAFLGSSTPPGAKYGSSVSSPYLVLRPRADTPTAPSTTTYTFDAPTPDTGWAFVLGDVDADQVSVSATDVNGATVPGDEVTSWFRGTFNYAGGADRPTWNSATSTLTGNAGAADTDGAAGWFEPDIRLTSLTMTFTRRAGFPVYQTWFVSRARPIGGTVADVSTVGACPLGSTTLRLVSPFGDTLATTTPATDGSYSFGELATQSGYTVRVDAPAGCVVLGPAEQTASNRGTDNDPASRADFDIRAIIPQPISGTVRDDAGAPVAGVTVTLTGPGGPATTTTAADGSYLFDDNPIGTGYRVTIEVPGGYTAGPGGTEIEGIAVANVPVPAQDFTVVDLPAVTGTVTGAGAGVGGVQVVLTPIDGGPAFTTVTTGDGAYEVNGLPPGDYTLDVVPPDGWSAPATQTITVPTSGLTGQDVALTRPGALGGAVSTDGAPARGVTVTVDGPGGTLELQTDDDGRYFLEALPAGTYTTTITVPDGTTATGSTTRTTTITEAGEVRGGLDFTLTTALAQPDVASTPQNVTIAVDVVTNDTPGTGQTFDRTSVVFESSSATNGGRTLTVPGEGTYNIDPATGAVTFGPEPGFSGQATSVGYEVSDSNGTTVRSTVTITVTPAPPVPPVPPIPPEPPLPPVPADTNVDLVLSKRAVSGTQAKVGTTVRYQLTVRNKGATPSSRPVTLVDSLPAGLELVSAKGKAWTCTTRRASDRVSCLFKKAIGTKRKAAPVVVVAKATGAAMGRVVNTAHVRVAGESARSDNRATAVVTVVPAHLPATGFRLQALEG